MITELALGAAIVSAASAPSASGTLAQFQVALERSWTSALAGRHVSHVMPPNVKPGYSLLMKCSPATLLEDSQLSIAVGHVTMTKNYSLVSIDEVGRIQVIVSTAKDGYIGDNSIQPNLIRADAVVRTVASETYGHMDATGYPYAAFGPLGRHLILLLDDAVVFGRRGIGTFKRTVPHVIAGCAVSWNGRH
jgi:hypothetical protein